MSSAKMCVCRYAHTHAFMYTYRLLLSWPTLGKSHLGKSNVLQDKSMGVDPKWVKYTRLSGRSSAPKLVMLNKKMAINWTKQLTRRLPRDCETRKGLLEKQYRKNMSCKRRRDSGNSHGWEGWERAQLVHPGRARMHMCY